MHKKCAVELRGCMNVEGNVTVQVCVHRLSVNSHGKGVDFRVMCLGVFSLLVKILGSPSNAV
jgi:hypothetical protein